MPKPPPDKNAAKKNQTKSSRNKKEDELPPSNWAGMPQPKPKTDYQHLDTYKDIKEEEDELEELNSGVMSDIEVAPELIREVSILMPFKKLIIILKRIYIQMISQMESIPI